MISEEKMNQIQPRINYFDKDSKNIASCELSKFVEEELSMNNLPNYKNCGIYPGMRFYNRHSFSSYPVSCASSVFKFKFIYFSKMHQSVLKSKFAITEFVIKL